MTTRPSRFEELLQRWQEGEATTEELAEFEAILKSDARYRRALVSTVRVEAALDRAPAPVARTRRRWLEATAAILLVGISFAVILRKPEPVRGLPTLAVAKPLTPFEQAVANLRGTVYKIEFEDDLYSVAYVQGYKRYEVELDPQTGRRIEGEQEGFGWDLDVPPSGSVSLMFAIRGRDVLEAVYEKKAHWYRIRLRDGSTVYVDAATGRTK